MNDPKQDKWREASWRRPLTPAEAAELHSWLSAHPADAADWEAEIELSQALRQLPEAPVSSNFTARVLAEATHLQSASGRRTRSARPWWLSLVPRMAVATLLVATGLAAYHQHQVARRERIARDLATLPDVAAISDPKVIQDFEAIRRLGQTPPADEELIALLK